MEVLSPFTGFFREEKRRSNLFAERPKKRARLEEILPIQNLFIDDEPIVAINRKRKYVEYNINIVKRPRVDKPLLAVVKIQLFCRRWLCKQHYKARAVTKIQKVFRSWIIRRSFHIIKFAFYTC
jgi:hypothetical protein